MQPIRYWLDAALEANRRDHTPAHSPGEQTGPVRSARALGMTMIAMHDAFFGITGNATHYRVMLAPTGTGLNPRIAAAAAAYGVLSALHPHQLPWLHDTWQHFAGTTNADLPSMEYGDAVAREVIAWRAGDVPLFGPGFTPSGQPYDHDVDPLHPGQGFDGALWGGAPSFLEGLALLPFAPPPGASTTGGPFQPGAYYAQEFEEVRKRGAELSAFRTTEQEEIGIFWGYDGAREVGTPPRLYLQVAMTVLDGYAARPTSTWLNQARYLEAVTAIAVGMADAGIQAWHYKYADTHRLWRPVLGIRQAPAGVPGTVADPGWRPLGLPRTNETDPALGAATPNFPSYPSGHATFGGVAFEVLRRWLRHHDSALAFADGDVDPIEFTFVSDEYNGRNTDLRTGQPRPRVARSHGSLWQAIVENSESRIWLGVHWRMDGISRQVGGGAPESARPASPAELGPYGGTRLGMDIARELATTRGFAS